MIPKPVPDIAVDPSATEFQAENYVKDAVVTTLTCTTDSIEEQVYLTDDAVINMACPDVENLSPSVVSGTFPRDLHQKCTCNVTDGDYFTQSYLQLVNACMFEFLFSCSYNFRKKKVLYKIKRIILLN